MWLNTLENIFLRNRAWRMKMLLSPSKSSSSTISTSKIMISMLAIVISTTAATSWASVREQRRKRSVYENGKQLFTQSVSLVLKSTNQWQCLQKKYTGVFILEDQIGRFGDFDIWNKTLIVRVAWKHSGSSSRANLHAKAAWCQVFYNGSFLNLFFSDKHVSYDCPLNIPFE